VGDRRADVLRAFTVLGIGADDHVRRDEIARLFGMEWVPARTAAAPPERAALPAPAAPSVPRAAVARPLRREPREPPPREAVREQTAQAFRLTRLENPEQRPPAWVDEARPLPRADEWARAPLPVEPLFDPQQSRAVLSGALSRRLYDGPLDVRTVVERIGRGEALLDLPRVAVPSIARGVQLLIDIGEGMAPYAADVAWIRGAFSGVVGSHALEVLQFAYCPMRGAGKRSRRTWQQYPLLTPPRRGATVVAVTDLGIRGLPPPVRPASIDEWVQFADHLDRQDCPLLAIVPYEPSRVPMRLRKRFAIVEWERRTTAARVRALLARNLP
jgi:hypothetical protein